jgi:acetyltransferase-like isoleucine patch superfamily enzyme
VGSTGPAPGADESAADETVQVQELARESARSALARYRELVIGRPGWWALARHELIALAAGPCPGALGLALRAVLYPRLLGAVGRGAIFGRSVTLRHPHKIRLGAGVLVDDYAVLDAKGSRNEGIALGDGVMISRNCALSCKGGSIRIGAGAVLGANSLIHAEAGSDVEIGEGAAIAAFVYLIGGGNYRLDRPHEAIKDSGSFSRGGIRIGRGAWLGSHVQVLDGARIGEGAVVAAGAVVRSDVAPLQIVGGVPARPLGTRRTAQA